MRTKQQLTDCGAKIIIDNPEELYDIIGSGSILYSD